jgi:hypothetical protein
MDEEIKDDSVEISLETSVGEFKPKPKKADTNKVVVTLVPGSFIGYAYIGVGGDGTGYLIPSGLVDEQEGNDFSIDLADKDIKLLYNWTKEIEAMLPSKAEMVANIRKALWTNGAHQKESLKLSVVQRNLMRGAFPYRINIEEE